MTIRTSATWWLGWPALSTYLIVVNALAGIVVLLVGAVMTAASR